MSDPAAPIRRSAESQFVEESFALRRAAQKAYAEKAFAALGEVAFQDEPRWARVTALVKLLQQVLCGRDGSPDAGDAAEDAIREVAGVGEKVRAKLDRIAARKEGEEAGE